MFKLIPRPTISAIAERDAFWSCHHLVVHGAFPRLFSIANILSIRIPKMTVINSDAFSTAKETHEYPIVNHRIVDLDQGQYRRQV